MKKHLLNILTFQLFLTCAFAVCLSATSISAPQRTRINMMSDFGNSEEIQQLLRVYAPFADVNFVVVGDNGFAKIPLLKDAGQVVHVALLDFPQAAQLARQGLLEPLDSYMAGPDPLSRDSIWPNAWDAVTVGGKIYGVPVHVTLDALVYNKDLLSKLGIEPPKTWEQFSVAAEKIATEKNPDGTPVHYGAYFRDKFEAWLSIYASRSGRITDDTGTKILFDNKDAVESLRLIAGLHRPGGPVPLTEPFGRSLSLDQAPMMILFDEELDKVRDMPASAAPMPSDGASVPNLRGKALVMFKDAPQDVKKAAWKLFKVFAGTSVQTLVSQTTGWLSVNRKAAKSAAVKADLAKRPLLQSYYDTIEQAKPFAVTQGQGAELYDILRAAVLDAIWGVATPEQAISSAAARAHALLETSAALQPGNARENPSPFGILICFGNRYPPEEMDRAGDLADQAGIRWNREELAWSLIEPERGKFTWERYDTALAAAARHGIRNFGLLDYTVGWSSNFAPRTDAQRADFANYVFQTVSRYKNQIKYWEIWNEENISVFWTPMPSAADYVALLKEAYLAVKRADPTAQVMLGGTSGADLDWIDKIYKNGGGDYFDILAFHPYMEKSALDDERYIRNLEFIRLLMARNGGVKPAWITEVGWPTTRGGITQEEQAAAYAKMVAHSLGSGYVRVIVPYDFRDDAVDPDYGEANFGIVQRDFTPKSAFKTYSFLANRLAAYTAARRSDPAPGITSYEFTVPGGTFTVIWASKKGDVKKLGFKSAGKAELFSLTGESVRAMSPGEAVEIPLTDSPVFIVQGPAGN